MNEHDRQSILEAILDQGNKNPVIVLHGTDTMDQTAKFCLENHPEVSVPVVFNRGHAASGL